MGGQRQLILLRCAALPRRDGVDGRIHLGPVIGFYRLDDREGEHVCPERLERCYQRCGLRAGACDNDGTPSERTPASI